MFEKIDGSATNGQSQELRGVQKIWNRKGVGKVSGPESIEMMWIEWMGTILLAGVDSRSKWSVGTGQTEVRLDAWCESGLGKEGGF